jgi:hypothetical protein
MFENSLNNHDINFNGNFFGFDLIVTLAFVKKTSKKKKCFVGDAVE